MGVTWCRFREKAAMQEAKEEFKDLIERFIALQFIFDKQWRAVKVRTALTDLHQAKLNV